MSKLKSCPFCSGGAVLDGKSDYARVRCETCGAEGTVAYLEGDGKSDIDACERSAIRAWNRRPTTTLTQERVREIARKWETFEDEHGYGLTPEERTVQAINQALAEFSPGSRNVLEKSTEPVSTISPQHELTDYELLKEIDDTYSAAIEWPCTCHHDEISCKHCGLWEKARTTLRKALSTKRI